MTSLLSQNAQPTTVLTPFEWTAEKLQIATQSVQGVWHSDDTQNLKMLVSTKISTDTRAIGEGDIFLALSGDNFDGHNYATMAVEKGAIAIVVERVLDDIKVPQLVVSDTRLALGQLGGYRRNQHTDLTVIALTGSSGKTTVKEMLGSIFSRLAPTLITRGNLNNDLGVPMMLLEICDEHKFAILELGANHLGEIAYTAELVQPDVACVLNIGTAHLGEFGGRDNIAKAKAEIYQALNHSKTAVIPDTDDYAEILASSARQYTDKVVGFGRTDVQAQGISVDAFSSSFEIVSTASDSNKSQRVNLPLAGQHNVTNALAVTACAQAVGITIEDIVIGLERAEPAKGRLFSKVIGKHRLIDDAYNANPHSTRASAQVLASQPGFTVMVIGDIAELGDSAIAEHYNLGADMATMDIDAIYALGEYAQSIVDGALSVSAHTAKEVVAFNDKAVLGEHLERLRTQYADRQFTVLFKGSRFMKMETLFEKLLQGY